MVEEVIYLYFFVPFPPDSLLKRCAKIQLNTGFANINKEEIRASKTWYIRDIL
jgi:hypothetical protein